MFEQASWFWRPRIQVCYLQMNGKSAVSSKF